MSNDIKESLIDKDKDSGELHIELKGNIALNSNQITNVKDINNPYIYSYVDWHPYSFCTGHS